MRAEVRAAIDSARSTEGDRLDRFTGPRRGMSFDRVRATVLNVVRELPEGMSVQELRDELEIANCQALSVR